MRKNKLNKTLGIIGGGQLGKMIGLAAANLGISCYFYDSDKNAPAQKISQLFFNYSFFGANFLIIGANYNLINSMLVLYRQRKDIGYT